MSIMRPSFALLLWLVSTAVAYPASQPGPASPPTLAAAERGSADAQYATGMAYDLGQGVPVDYVAAVRWYRAAAEQGHADAQFALAEMYKNGDGVGKSLDEALRWYRKAAAHGQAGAELMLGVLYESGVGVRADVAEAARWYRLSSDHGDARAQLLLGVLYQTGQGVRWDPVAAWALYSVSAAHDSSRENPAPGHRAMLEREMTPLQVGQADALARSMLAPGEFAKAFDRYLASGAAGPGR